MTGTTKLACLILIGISLAAAPWAVAQMAHMDQAQQAGATDDQAAQKPMTPEQMQERHRQVMQRWQQADQELQQKVQAMNQATGEAKVQAMSDVLNTLVQQRQQMHQEMQQMAHMMMQQHGMGGGMHGMMHGGTATTQPARQHQHGH